MPTVIRHADLPAASVQGRRERLLAGDDSVAIRFVDITRAGSWNELPGWDRICTVISGELLLLEIDGVPRPVEPFRPFRFSADTAAGVKLPTGDVVVLEVATRRNAAKGYATVLELSKKRPHPVFSGQLAVLLQGTASVGGDTVERLDAVSGAEPAPEISGRGFLAVISIEPVESA
jgi:environmental stress-induced protein Ves